MYATALEIQSSSANTTGKAGRATAGRVCGEERIPAGSPGKPGVCGAAERTREQPRRTPWPKDTREGVAPNPQSDTVGSARPVGERG